MRHVAPAACSWLVLLCYAAPALSGGVEGTMYSLQPPKYPIVGETIQIRVIDKETGNAIEPVSASGAPFPAGQVDPSTFILSVAAPTYALRLRPIGGANPRRIVDIQFIRESPKTREKGVTNILKDVIISDGYSAAGATDMLKMDLAVPVPPDPPASCYHYAYTNLTNYVPARNGCFGLRRRR